MMPHLRDLCSETRQALKQNRNLRCPQAEHYALFQMVTTLTRFSWTSTKICVNKEDFKGPCSQVLSNFLSDLPLCAVKHAALSGSPSRLLFSAFQALIQMYWSWHSCGAMKGERLKQKGSKPHTLQTQQLCKNCYFVRSGKQLRDHKSTTIYRLHCPCMRSSHGVTGKVVPRNNTPTRGCGEGGVTTPWLRYIWPTLKSFMIFLYRTSHKQTQYYVGHVWTTTE